MPSSTVIWLFVVLAFVVLILSTLMFLASRYKRCSSDQILVTYAASAKISPPAASTAAVHSSGRSFRITPT